jgi:predicted glycosyltransferase
MNQELMASVLDALSDLIEKHGKQEVINTIHQYFHQGQPDVR